MANAARVSEIPPAPMGRTVGQVRLDRDRREWVVLTEPHIRLRMKRVFARIPAEQHGLIRLSDTQENARELLWFLARYPMQVDPLDYLELQSWEHEERENAIAELLRGKFDPEAFDLAVPAREYQKLAAAMLLTGGGLLLADDVGLGKTASAICTFTDPRTRPALVVTLAHLPRQWDLEVKRFAPSLRTHIVKKGTPYDLREKPSRADVTLALQRGDLAPQPRMPDVIITSYSKLEGWADVLGGIVKSVVFDECVTADTLVAGDEARRIVDLEPGHEIYAFDRERRIVRDRVVGITPKGFRLVWRLTLADGRSLECTENERILTSAGWAYAAEVIDAACSCYARNATHAADGKRAAGDPGLAARGRRGRLLADESSARVHTLGEASRLCRTEGGETRAVREDGAGASPESWLWPPVLHVPHSDDARLRILALALLPHGERAPDEDGHHGVACAVDVGGRCVLVHGRRNAQPRRSDHQHALVPAGSSRAARCLVVGARHLAGDRHGSDAAGQEVLDASLPARGDAGARRAAPAVRSPIDDLQARDYAAEHRDVRCMRRGDPDGASQAGDTRGVRPPRVSTHPLQPVAVAAVECLGVRAVYDVETERHHTLFANGFAVHNCQELRHRQHGNKPSKRWHAAMHVAEKAAFRMGLSATPIYNYGGEIHNVLSVVHPGALGTREEFITEWCNVGGEKPQIKDPKVFGTYVRDAGLMLRRTRADVGRELPPITKVPHSIDSDLKELEKVESSASELARIVLSQNKDRFAGETREASAQLSNILRQATGIAKAPFVAAFVRLLVESGEKVVLYGWHREVYALWQEKLEDLKPQMYTGTEDAGRKQRSKDAFVDGDAQVLIISLRAGAGLDGLQKACRTVVFGELDWSPGVHEQCIGRVARDGQPDPVVAYFLIAEAGVDPTIASVLQIKAQQSEGIRAPDAELVEQLQVDPDHVKKLAAEFLRQRGMLVPTEVRNG